MRAIAIATSVAVTSSLVLTATASPAAAADKILDVYPSSGVPEPLWSGRGHFYDDEDLLCAMLGQNEAHDRVVVRIRPANGDGPVLRVVDDAPLPAGSGMCRDASAIPEGAEYRMRVKEVDLDGDVYIASSSFLT